MFSNKISTQDLFYSNPVDRFLGNDGGLLNSLESGFSSSHGISQKNSKELPSTCSQDLFSQTPKQTIGETQDSNIEYQKYISQNLLFGKRSSGKFSYENQTKEQNLKKNFSSNENPELNAMSEIKNVLVHLNDNIKKLKDDASDIRTIIFGMQNEFSKQNERISSYEEFFSNQTNILKETVKCLKENPVREDRGMKKILNEKFDIITNSMDDMRNSIDAQQNKVLETLKRYSTNQTNANKKTIEGIKNCNQQIMRKIDSKTEKIYSTIEICIKEGTDDIEKKVGLKFADLKTFIDATKTSIVETVTSQKISFVNSTHTASVFSKQHNGEKTGFKFENSTFRKPSFNGSMAQNSSYETKNQRFPFSHPKQPLTVTQSSVHTPIASVIKQNQRSSFTPLVTEKSQKTKQPVNVASNRAPPYIHKHYSKFSIKEKYTSPIIKSQRILERKNFTEDLHSNVKEGRVTRNSYAYRNPNKARKSGNADGAWPAAMRKNTIETATINSSPYLTVYEAALAEEYSFM